MNDPQVLAAQSFPERRSMLDVMLNQYDVGAKDPCNPFLMRVLLCGKHGDDPLNPILEEISNEACMKADMSHPFFTNSRGSGRIHSVVIDYGDRFLQLVEGCERHVHFYLDELKSLQEKKRTVDCVVVLYVDDDFDKCCGEGWLFLDKIPSGSMGSSIAEKTEDEAIETVLTDLNNVLELSSVAAEHFGTKRQIFADNAKMNYPRLFPKLDILNMYMKSTWFFTLKEFEEVFFKFPEITREVEINHPADDPLKH